MTEEQLKAIKNMERFVNSTTDTTVVTAKDMKEVLNIIQNKDKVINEMANTISRLYVFTDEKSEEIKQYFEKMGGI